jgi:hypothetical protein
MRPPEHSLAHVAPAHAAAHVWRSSCSCRHRSQQRSQWLEVPHRVSPRFGVAKTVLIDGVPTDWDGHSEYKM